MVVSVAGREALGKWVRRDGGNFVDLVRIRVQAGCGGDGSSAFARSLKIPRGRPSGGSGGRGGNVLVAPDPSLDSLGHIPKLVRAKKGGHGGSNLREGAVGQDVWIRVPLGTEIREIVVEQDAEDDLAAEYVPDFVLVNESSDTPSDDQVVDDPTLSDDKEFKEPDHPFLEKISVPPRPQTILPVMAISDATDSPLVVVQGGRGGRGNHAFGNNNRDCEKGQPGEERIIELDLKTVADVGLVGLPNAGKSSFLAAVSNAHPKIASYPFTTLNPYRGIIEYGDGRRMSLADIPGLIKDAHKNRGLGHQFLKHVVKSRLLVLVVDFAQKTPQEDIKTLLYELDCYQPGLSNRCKLVVANKADLLDAATLLARVKRCVELVPTLEILPASALHGLAIEKITERLWRLLH